MTFDLSGRAPISEMGHYFNNTIWWWHPLAEFVLRVCDIPQAEANYWHSNDGQYVSKKTAMHIAERLQKLVESGEVRKDVEERKRRYESLPEGECDVCDGTGQRGDEGVKVQCNVCGGKGLRRPSDSNHLFSEENVVEFINFCRNSGGFHIR